MDERRPRWYHFWGPGYFLSRWLFLRLLGIIYLIAFISFWVQFDGLIGKDGILPVSEFLARQGPQLGAARYHLLPTFCWLNESNAFLHSQCAAGTVLSTLLIVGIAPIPVLLLLWALYLSLSTAGQDFWWFQWDILLLETGFLAIFLAPRTLRPGLRREAPPSRIILFLLWWLLFRLMFLSGVVKLAAESGLPHGPWKDLTALTIHYETQPLPVWTSWYAHQLPLWFHKLSCAIMFAIELGLPFLIFAPRALRFAAGGGFVFLMILIGLTGNYNFFNLLTVALCFLLLDDAALGRFIPDRWRDRVPTPAVVVPRWWKFVSTVGAAAVAIVVVPITAAAADARLSRGRTDAPRFVHFLREKLDEVREWLQPFRTFNSYGLFASMTVTRPEIIIEGSNDGREWQPYEFRWKPGDLSRPPGFVQPHQPRLDWQMWFAALRPPQRRPIWFDRFMRRLHQGSPAVLRLLENNPFPEGPPRYVRAVLYRYNFTNWEERRETGQWWKRVQLGPYSPTLGPISKPREPR
jgi:hypothetical protein